MLKLTQSFLRIFSLVSLISTGLFFFAAPSFSDESLPLVPGLESIRPFSAEANYMSREGYVISYYRTNHGVEISRGEARKIVKEAIAARGRAVLSASDVSAAAANAAAVSEVPVSGGGSITVERDSKGIKELAVLKKSDVSLEYKDIAKNAKRSRRVVVVPFFNRTGAKAAGHTVDSHVKRLFKLQGYRVVNMPKFNNVIKGMTETKDYTVFPGGRLERDVTVKNSMRVDPENLTDLQIKAIAEKFKADFIVFGDIDRYSKEKDAVTSGRVKLSTRIYNAGEGKFVYENSISDIRKYNAPEPAFRDALMRHSANKAVYGLYKGFFKY